MLNPSVTDLLAGVADALAATAADGLAPGPERDQVRAAVAIIRRVTRVLPTLTPVLQQDTRALAAAVRKLSALIDEGLIDEGLVDEGRGTTTSPDLAAALAFADGLPSSPLPGLDQLAAADLVLRGELARLAVLDDLPPTAEVLVQDELRALAARQAALRLSPWER